MLNVSTLSSSVYLNVPDIPNSVHDGWGVATEPGLEGNAIEAGTTTNMDTIAKDHSHRLLAAHGVAVGLSDGLMGNSEVGWVLVHFVFPKRQLLYVAILISERDVLFGRIS